MKLYILIVFTLFFIISCQPEIATVPSNPPLTQQLAPCTGDKQNEYIKAEIDGVKKTFDKKWKADVVFENVHIYNPGTIDQLNLIRHDSNYTYNLQLYFLYSQFHKKPLPYILPRTDRGDKELADIEFGNLKSVWYSQCNGCPQDDANYFADTFSNSLKVTISDTACSYVKGSFEGTLSTKTGKKLSLKNGEFNIKIKRVPFL